MKRCDSIFFLECFLHRKDFELWLRKVQEGCLRLCNTVQQRAMLIHIKTLFLVEVSHKQKCLFRLTDCAFDESYHTNNSKNNQFGKF